MVIVSAFIKHLPDLRFIFFAFAGLKYCQTLKGVGRQLVLMCVYINLEQCIFAGIITFKSAVPANKVEILLMGKYNIYP